MNKGELLENKVKEEVVNLFKKSANNFALPQEDPVATSEAFEVFKVSEFSNSILAVFGMGCAAINCDIEYASSLDTGITWDIVLISCSISTILLIISIIWRTNCILLWEKGRAIYSNFDTLFSSGKIKFLLFEVTINMLHPLWFLKNKTFESYNAKYNVIITYAYNEMLSICTILRLYHLINLLTIFSRYRTERSYRICKNNGNFAGTSWGVRSLIKDEPIKFVIIMMMTGILVGSFCIRIFERRLYRHRTAAHSQFCHSQRADDQLATTSL